jgi:hypothetical protein
MTENPVPAQFEEEIRAAFATLPANPEFVNRLHADLMQTARSKRYQPRRPWYRPRAWFVGLVLVAFTLAIAVIIGPQRVSAAIRRLFGYIPGVGIIDPSAPIRVLVQPVSVSKDGVSITVSSATLTADKTHIDYRVFGVAREAYPSDENTSGCMEREGLRLPDGTFLRPHNQDLAPVPAGVNQAVFVLPCIPGTLAGKAPANWEIPLRFAPAPASLTVMPVIELPASPASRQNTPTPGLQPATTEPSPPAKETVPLSNPPLVNPVSIRQVIETKDGYILIGAFTPPAAPDSWFQQTGGVEITDATGKKIGYDYPNDITLPVSGNEEQGGGWAVQFRNRGVTYPITIRFAGETLSRPDPNATAEVEFDAGPAPKPGQKWEIHQDIKIAGYSVQLVRVSYIDARSGYTFDFQLEPRVHSIGVAIAGQPASGGGGGGDDETKPGAFSVSLSFARLPAGKLKIVLSHLVLRGNAQTWQAEWSPASPKAGGSAVDQTEPGLCLTADALTRPGSLPAGGGGKALLYQSLNGSDQWGIGLVDLNHGTKLATIPGAVPGTTLSPDGNQIAYRGEDGIHIYDLPTGKERILKDAAGGYDLHWSPDGQRIAFISPNADRVQEIHTDGNELRTLSRAAYASIIGWDPNGETLYLNVPYIGSGTWEVVALNRLSGAADNRFTLENAARKAPIAVISPDGQWIAYRGQAQGSLHWIRVNGKDARQLGDDPTVAISGLTWSASGQLGVSLANPTTGKTTRLVILQPDGCRIDGLIEIEGDLVGLILP